VQVSGLRCVQVVGTRTPGGAGSTTDYDARCALIEVAEMTASSKQSSEHPVHQALGGVGDGPVTPKSNWLVRRGRDGTDVPSNQCST
jgi:hypothetical protein